MEVVTRFGDKEEVEGDHSKEIVYFFIDHFIDHR